VKKEENFDHYVDEEHRFQMIQKLETLGSVHYITLARVWCKKLTLETSWIPFFFYTPT
jgi:hypothetical protein